ncbi:MAG: MGMT family protein [Caldilinea sp.]|nr:MGMT family protein [Caldilinea sp.]MDW8442182.1 MGMT family protein [Caldilineaceae bacterium]
MRKDGELGGYRWGLARKRRLLEREGAGGWAAAKFCLISSRNRHAKGEELK